MGFAQPKEAWAIRPSFFRVVDWGSGAGFCPVGNIDLHYTLTLGTPEEVDAEVKQRIETIGVGGGYMISSANSITSYCRLYCKKPFLDTNGHEFTQMMSSPQREDS